MKLTTRSISPLIGLCTLAAVASSHAVVQVVENGPFGEGNGLDEAQLNALWQVKSGDLLESADGGSFTSGMGVFGGVLTTLTDGLAVPTPDSFYAQNGSEIDYLWATPVIVDSIDFVMYADWQRTSAYIDVFTSTDGGANWTLLHQVRQDEQNGGSVDREYNSHTMTDDAGDLASGINGIRFQILDDGMGANESGYTEIDVNGSFVPEPATFSLAALGLLLLGRRRRH